MFRHLHLLFASSLLVTVVLMASVYAQDQAQIDCEAQGGALNDNGDCIICNNDGTVDDGEVCDDGNAFNCDDCTNDCQLGPRLDFVLMTGGQFDMGDDNIRGARPAHKVILDNFWISRQEITNQDYEYCVNAGMCSEPSNREEGCTYHDDDSGLYPVNCVNWKQAVEFAHWCGTALNLPTEAQWEYAAKDQGDTVEYPTIDAPNCGTANFKNCGNEAQPVCGHGADTIHWGMIVQNQSGMCDLAGNLSEWIFDTYISYKKFTHQNGEPYHVEGRRGRNKVIRGGSFNSRRSSLRSSYRGRYKSNLSSSTIGFRVACVEGDCPIVPLPVCGNTLEEEGEECDDGNLTTETCNYGEEACTVCAADCTLQAGEVIGYCGDGVTQDEHEGCDDGNTVTEVCDYGLTECGVCAADCTKQLGETSYCGDSIVNDFEECDDGNDSNADFCLNFCVINVCGDGFDGGIIQNEECDDENLDVGDGCDNLCRVEECGNGRTDANEDCDDGNTTTEACDYGEVGCQVCAADCTDQAGATSFCGDATTDAANGEGCDDGNTTTETCVYGEESCTVCAADCTNQDGQVVGYCGDGVTDAGNGEQCDGEGYCKNDCTTDWTCDFAIYGDGGSCDCGCGIADSDCAGGGCTGANCVATDGTCNFCHDENGNQLGDCPGFCGDGFTEGGEECEPGVTFQGEEFCNNDCTIIPDKCGNGILEPAEECDGGDGCNDDCTFVNVGGVPASWVCDPSYYGAEAAGIWDNDCDCGCGAIDPDCQDDDNWVVKACATPGCCDMDWNIQGTGGPILGCYEGITPAVCNYTYDDNLNMTPM